MVKNYHFGCCIPTMLICTVQNRWKWSSLTFCPYSWYRAAEFSSFSSLKYKTSISFFVVNIFSGSYRESCNKFSRYILHQWYHIQDIHTSFQAELQISARLNCSLLSVSFTQRVLFHLFYSVKTIISVRSVGSRKIPGNDSQFTVIGGDFPTLVRLSNG